MEDLGHFHDTDCHDEDRNTDDRQRVTVEMIYHENCRHQDFLRQEETERDSRNRHENDPNCNLHVIACLRKSRRENHRIQHTRALGPESGYATTFHRKS